MEWLQSSIRYLERARFVEEALSILPEVYSTESGIYHYRSMAKTNYRGYLRADQVPLKKYFYVLRPLLAIRWIERYGTAAPIEFERLLHLIEDRSDILAAIDTLLRLKRASPELGLADPVPSLNLFIENELERHEQTVPDRARKVGAIAKLNSLFHATIADRCMS